MSTPRLEMLTDSLREVQEALQREDLPPWMTEMLSHLSSELQRHLAAEEQKRSENGTLDPRRTTENSK